MSTETITLRNRDVLSDDDINSPREWLISRRRLLDSPGNTVTQAEQLNGRGSSFPKCSGYHLLGLVGVPLIVAVCLLLQLDKLSNSSLSYSLLNAIVSVLFNFTSSALLKTFSFFISLLGLSRWFTPSAQ
jgi:hypothetical protein